MPKGASAFKGDAQQLAQTLKPFVTRPKWFKYGESQLDFGKVRQDILVAHKQLFASLLGICPNLIFPKPVLTIALRQLGQQFPVLEPPGELDHWCETMVKRLSMACKHVAKAMRHKPPPQWLQHIVPMASSVAAAATDGSAAAAPEGSAAAPAAEAAAEAAAGQEAAAEAHLETHTRLHQKHCDYYDYS
jgi:hypothetical protein